MPQLRSYPYILGVILGLCLVSVFVWSVVLSDVYSHNQLSVHFLDVGQGDAIFIESPTGRQVLVDAGRAKQVMRELGGIMPALDRSIDMVVGTHADKDHIGGLPAVLDRYRVSTAVVPQLERAKSAHASALLQRLQNEQAAAIRPHAGQVYNLGGGVRLHVLFPDRYIAGTENDESAVLLLDYKDTEILLTGDITDSVEAHLENMYGNTLRSDILKVAHHGSDTSSRMTFLETVAAEYAVIQAGADNPYGHPTKEVLERLQQVGVQTLCTCKDGAIHFTSDGTNIRYHK